MDIINLITNSLAAVGVLALFDSFFAPLFPKKGLAIVYFSFQEPDESTRTEAYRIVTVPRAAQKSPKILSSFIKFTCGLQHESLKHQNIQYDRDTFQFERLDYIG